MFLTRHALVGALVLALAGCAYPWPPESSPDTLSAYGHVVSAGTAAHTSPVSPHAWGASPAVNPEAASGWTSREPVYAERFMVVSANPLASRAGEQILAAGGSAADAIIAMQWVLGLVEPQSSGLGGGAFAIAYNAADHQLQVYDGRETAPMAARADRFMQQGQPIPFSQAVHSGLSVGVPGMVAMLERLHEQQGRLPWATLFEPAITLAEQGFPVSPRLHALLDLNKELRESPTAAPYFYDAQLNPWPVGYRLRNPEQAKVLRTLAREGAQAFYHGSLARDMVRAVQRHPVPGDLTLDDLARYRAVNHPALCAPYRQYQLCGPPPPSSGPLAVMQMLGMLAHTPMAQAQPESPQAVHYLSEAGRLAFADRDHYVADPAAVAVPVQGLLNPHYLRERAALIRPDRSLGVASHGMPPGASDRVGHDATPELAATTHLVAVDPQGDVVSMTSSIENAFGSKIMVNGYLLNNQLTDFSLSPVDARGLPVANRVEPGKRPRSSMAPMLVLQGNSPYMAIGSPGGSSIINYVAKALIGVLDWQMTMQQAIDLPNHGSRNRATELEQGRASPALKADLIARGHTLREQDMPSGLHGIRRLPDGRLEGGADPRREGLALGR